MGFTTVEEQKSQLGALVREKEALEKDLAYHREELEAAKEAGDTEQAAFYGRRVRRMERTLKANEEQLTLVGQTGQTKQARTARR